MKPCMLIRILILVDCLTLISFKWRLWNYVELEKYEVEIVENTYGLSGEILLIFESLKKYKLYSLERFSPLIKCYFI